MFGSSFGYKIEHVDGKSICNFECVSVSWVRLRECLRLGERASILCFFCFLFMIPFCSYAKGKNNSADLFCFISS